MRDPFFTRLSRLTDSNFRFFTGFHSFFSFFRCPAKRVDFDSTRSLIPLFSNAGTERGLNYAVSSFSFCLKCSSNAPSQDMPHLQHGGGDHARARGPPADRSPCQSTDPVQWYVSHVLFVTQTNIFAGQSVVVHRIAGYFSCPHPSCLFSYKDPSVLYKHAETDHSAIPSPSTSLKRKATAPLEYPESSNENAPASSRSASNNSIRMITDMTHNIFKRIRRSKSNSNIASKPSSQAPTVRNSDSDESDTNDNHAREQDHEQTHSHPHGNENVDPTIESKHEQFLCRHGYIWYKEYGLLVCIICETAVEHCNARAHSVGHKLGSITHPPNAEFIVVFQYYNAPDMPNFGDVPISPIPGLPIITRKRCLHKNRKGAICYAIPGSDSSLYRHFGEAHKQKTASTDEVSCHLIFKFRGISSYVHVDPRLADKPKSSVLASYLDRVSERPAPSYTVFKAQSVASMKSGFIYASKWDRALDGVDIEEIIFQASLPTQEEPALVFLQEGVVRYMHTVAAELPNINTLYLRHIATAKGCVFHFDFVFKVFC